MKNKISIDELVRRHVSQGEEPHNLGAWANMERMLDGHDPYEKEKDDKKRPILFWFLSLLLCSTAVVGSYQYFSAGGSNQSSAIATSPSNTNAANHENISVNNDAKAMDFSEPNNDGEDNTMLAANNANDQTETYESNHSAKSALSEKTAATINTSLSNENTALNSLQSNENSTTNSVQNNSRNTTANMTIRSSKSSETNKTIAKKSNRSINSVLASKNTQASVAEYAQKETLLDAQQNEVQPVISEKYSVTTPVTKITQRFERNGRKKRLVSDSVKYKIVQEKKRLVVNPRYVELSQEQEAAAQRKTNPIISHQNNVPNVATKISSTASSKLKSKALVDQQEVGLSANAAQKNKKGFFSIFKKAAQGVNQKAINIAHTKFPIYTGMFAGINAALLNTQHNFGGFQTGLTAMTPLSRIFTLQTELRFTHMNNSAYTIRDNRKEILSSTIDSTSVFKSKIYSYDVDSISKGYNLQNFYSMQMPILLNANFNKFSTYAGLNIHYGFRMNVQSSQQSNIITIKDTISTGQAYTQRSSSEMKFTREDFGSRFGLGYTIGGAYNFNPNLYIDLRMSNPIWDNTKGAAKQEISDVFFKIPSFQLSLGYRFRKFKPE